MHECLDIRDQFVYSDHKVVLTSDLEISIDGKPVSIGQFDSIDEAREFAKSFIDNSKLVNEVKTIPDHVIIGLVRKHHESVKVTSKLIESYSKFAQEKTFALDPVITEMKKNDITNFQNKLEFRLDDGSMVAIDEDTHDKLCNLYEDKYSVVEYMRESKENFMHIIKQLEEE